MHPIRASQLKQNHRTRTVAVCAAHWIYEHIYMAGSILFPLVNISVDGTTKRFCKIVVRCLAAILDGLRAPSCPGTQQAGPAYGNDADIDLTRSVGLHLPTCFLFLLIVFYFVIGFGIPLRPPALF